MNSTSALACLLITPARNEAAFIEQTIQSVIAQKVRPVRWVIVSDGSTDRTDEIVARYTVMHPWIELVQIPPRAERHFAGKVHAFNAGYDRVKHLPHDVVGSLDGDITFDSEYFAFLLGKLRDDLALGLVGTPFREGERQYDYRFTSIEHVSGACQLFRRDCFAAIGGYQPIGLGGVDLVACISARMKGWQTRTFPEKWCMHHRTMGTAKRSPLMVAFKGGRGDYMLGGHPIWEAVRCIYQMSNPPIVLGGMLRLVGFSWAMVTRVRKAVSPELMRFRRAEQMRRLRQFLRRWTSPFLAPEPSRGMRDV